MDIESSGLFPNGIENDKGHKDSSYQDDFITCIGVLTPQGIIQFTDEADGLRSNPLTSERLILQNFGAWLQSLHLNPINHDNPDNIARIITYNGISFDFNFIRNRCEFQGLPNILPSSLDPLHLDIAPFVYKLMGRYTSKDDACRKLANMYVPRKSEGFFCARIYKTQKLTDVDHIDMLQHNSVDLCVTAKLFDYLRKFEDFQIFMASPSTWTKIKRA